MAFWYVLVLPHDVAWNFRVPLLPDDLSVLVVYQLYSEYVLRVAYKKPNLANLLSYVNIDSIHLPVA